VPLKDDQLEEVLHYKPVEDSEEMKHNNVAKNCDISACIVKEHN
jgi:hypothetical protein